MAEQKDDLGQAAKQSQPRKATQSSGATEQFTAQDRAAPDRVIEDDKPSPTAGIADKTPATVVRRKQRYLIGFRSLPGITPPPTDPFLERLAQMDGVEIIRRLRCRNSEAAAMTAAAMTPSAAAPATASHEILVARMDEQRGTALRQNAPP